MYFDFKGLPFEKLIEELVKSGSIWNDDKALQVWLSLVQFGMTIKTLQVCSFDPKKFDGCNFR